MNPLHRVETSPDADRGSRRASGWARAGLAVAALGAATAIVQEIVARIYYRRTSGPTTVLDRQERSAWTPLWHETLVPAEWAALMASPIYRGEGVPRGDGAPVVLVHGFLTEGTYLAPLRSWLERIGYRAQIADIGWNADCPDVLTDRLLGVIRTVHDGTRARVHLIGHSLGGLLSRSAALRARSLVASVATLGTPYRGLRVNPLLRLAADVVRRRIHARRNRSVEPQCFTLACSCDTVQSLHHPLPSDLPQLAVASTQDGFLDWRYCVDVGTTPSLTVNASHIGLVVNANVYNALAHHLAAARSSTRREVPVR